MSDPADPWVEQLRGRFLVFDGPDGSGKSTQCDRFARWVETAGVGVCRVREPGGTSIGEQIRQLLLDVANDDIDPRCELLLYMASRAQLVTQRIRPALDTNQLVLADRFISSTLAYQGSAGGLDPQDILEIGRIALRGCWPDITVIFDVDQQTAARRLTGGSKRDSFLFEPNLFSDRMEIKGQDYRQAVRQGYLQQATNQPDQYIVIDASGDPDSVFQELISRLQAKLSGDGSI